MPRYRYQPLLSKDPHDPDSPPKIRLLTILPGAGQDLVVVELRTVALTPKFPPAYEALSYVWGTRHEHEEDQQCFAGVVSAEESGPAKLHITPNLGVALRSLRLKDSPRCMWIDAICIDQDNLEERSSQVAFMGAIFKLAMRVVVWLGPADDTSDEACDLMAAISDDITSLGSPCTVQPKPNSKITSDQIHRSDWSPWDNRQSDAIYALLRRPWFERVWIRQEIGLAGPASIVACGAKTVPWPCFKEALLFVLAKWDALPLEDWRGLARRCDVLLPVAMFKGQLDFRDLRQYISRAQCADDRDRVYGALTLLGETAREMKIMPDYRVPTREVYVDATAKWIETQSSLDILRFCEAKNEDQKLHLPSWVLDPSTPPLLASPLENHVAYRCDTIHHRPPSHLALEGEETLRVSAVRIASTIKSVDIIFGLPGKTSTSSAGPIANICSALPPDVRTALYPDGTTPLLEAYLSTLGAGRLLRKRDVTQEMISLYHGSQSIPGLYEDMLALMHLVLAHPPTATEIEIQTLEGVFRNTVSRRVLFATDEGHVGLGPPGTRAGDGVYAVLGCTSPLVLRPVEATSEDHRESSGRFEIVGECYCHGFMASEAILGTLPAEIRVVDTLAPVGGVYECFFVRGDDEGTAEKSDVDPRIQKLVSKIWPQEMDAATLTERLSNLAGEEKVCLLKDHTGALFEDLLLV